MITSLSTFWLAMPQSEKAPFSITILTGNIMTPIIPLWVCNLLPKRFTSTIKLSNYNCGIQYLLSYYHRQGSSLFVLSHALIIKTLSVSYSSTISTHPQPSKISIPGSSKSKTTPTLRQKLLLSAIRLI